MRCPRVSRAWLLGVLPLAWLLPACGEPTTAFAAAPPVVVGLGDPALDACGRGLVLLDELGCVHCHHDERDGAQHDGRRGPDLGDVGRRIRADYLPRFLADPHGVEPGTTMPDLLADRSAAARAADAEALAHYLRAFGVREVAASAAAPDRALDAAPGPDPTAAARGRELFHAIGCVACHAPRAADGTEQLLPDSVPLGNLAAKYSFSGLREFLLAPRTVRPSARMPDLHLLPAEAEDLSHFMLARGRQATATATPQQVAAPDPVKVAAGRIRFAELGCASCHRLDDPQRPRSPPAKSLQQLDPTRGCLGERVGQWPFFALTATQRADLAEALRAPATPRTDERRIRQLLASRNCTACHQRGDFGGPAPDRSRFFTTTDVALGLDGHLPPPLTGVGSKLQPDWLRDAIAHGQAVRPYQRTRMPGFDQALADELAELLARLDSLPTLPLAPLPDDEEAAKEVKELGRRLVGEQGMNCISCHAFAGEQVGTMAAVDLVDSTAQRLRPQWFEHYLRTPLRFRPTTLMPQFFLDGVSTRPEFADGDVARQVDAIWHYLAEGRNVRKPAGMRRPPTELLVGDEAVLLRRSVQHTGKRGISVGYPLGVNLTFDAESLGLNQIWWGRFVDAAPVWTGQGSGQARILSKQLATLPKGPAFVVLPDADAPWPAASRRELGQQFLGYDLDARQRPSFRYVSAGVTITDTAVEVATAAEAAGGAKTRASLRRTLTFAGTGDQTLQFRAAVDARIDDLGDGVVQVGSKLRLRIAPAAFRIRPAGEQRELLIPINLQQGRAELVVDYRWQADGK